MSIRLANIGCWIAAAALGWGGLLACSVRGEDKSPSPPLPASNDHTSVAVPADSQASGARKNRLMQLEEELSKSLQVFKPKTSLEGVTAPRPRPAQPAPINQNKRVKEQADRKKNWAFMSPDDLIAGPTIEDLLDTPDYTPDGREKKAVSPLERFYDNLERRYSNKAISKPASKDDPLGPPPTPGSRDELASPEDANLPSGVRESEENLRKGLMADTPNLNPARTHRTFSDIFQFGERKPSPVEDLAHKALMKDYQQLLNATSVPQGGDPAKGLGAPSAADTFHQTWMNGGGLGGSGGPGRSDVFAPQASVADPTLPVGVPQDVTAKTLNQWNSLYAPPKVELPQPTRPPPPPEVQRRKF
jgi:hypothetical protein